MPVPRHRVVAALLLLALGVGLVAACGGRDPGATATPAPTGRYESIARPGGMSVHLPPGTMRQPYPLVIALHQLHIPPTTAESQWGLDALADKYGFAVAYPTGISLAWNAGSCCADASTKNVDDVGYIRAVIAYLARTFPIDRHRVYLVGLSNGGMLAYRYACQHADEIAGIGVVSASLQFLPCTPSVPVSVVAIAGKQDSTVPPDGSAYSPFLYTPITSLAASLEPFEKAGRCTLGTATGGSPPEAGDTPAPDASPQASATASPGTPDVARASCAGGTTIQSYVFPAGRHGWETGHDGSFDDGDAIWSALSSRRSVSEVPLGL